MPLPWLESGRLFAADMPVTPPKRFAFLFFGWNSSAGMVVKGEWGRPGTRARFASLETGQAEGQLHSRPRSPRKCRQRTCSRRSWNPDRVQPLGGRKIQLRPVSISIWLPSGETRPSCRSGAACERPVSGFHESSYSMMYSSHVSWSSPVSSPVPSELYPSLAFDSLFESSETNSHQRSRSCPRTAERCLGARSRTPTGQAG